MGKMGDLWLGTYDDLIHDWTQGNIDDDEFKKGMSGLGIDSFELDCIMSDHLPLRSVNVAFKPLFEARDEQAEV
jgi:hypothetical protein|tara:strand:- start:253 stop:474 length:222 start_codon:yes stop_codon:yes gene_type:complete